MPDGGWTFEGEPVVVDSAAVTLIHGSSFCVCGRDGEIRADRAQGVFHRDTRIVSAWHLRVDGAPVDALTVMAHRPYHVTLLGRVRSPAGQDGGPALIQRDRYVGSGLREDIVLCNFGPHTVTCELTIQAGADFADVFAVKEGRARPRDDIDISSERDRVRLARRLHGREWSVRVSAEGAQARDDQLVFSVTLAPKGTWSTSVQVRPLLDGIAEPLLYPLDRPVEMAVPVRYSTDWRRRTPVLRAAHKPLVTTLQRSRADLGALRIIDPQRPEEPVVAAGAPWFMALFGRDSLLASLMAIPVDPTLALGTLQTLARHQGSRIDPASEEEPGRILHEMRFGSDTSIALGGRNVYYGTADATPLFVVLLGQLHRWGIDPGRIEALVPHADRALEWARCYGDRDGDGFVEYRRTTDQGLVNQGWKDSGNGINFADGHIAQAPIALCEVQGYLYAAYRARADLARSSGDTGTAELWTRRAAELKEAFNERFWLPDKGWYAVGLDRDKRPIDALASNMGHCLWSGIVDEGKAAQVADRLLSPEMFTGWGVRTLATTMAAYNPLSYHNGSVWPHDNALIAAGLMRYGFVEHAQRVARGLLEAAEAFDGRLPELMCGFDRGGYPNPVPYPTSCSPQAWASATPVHLLRVLLRVEPDLPRGVVHIAPVLPPPLDDLCLENVPLGENRVRIEVSGGRTHLSGVPEGITVLHEPAPVPA